MSVLQDVRPGTACNGERWRRPANRGVRTPAADRTSAPGWPSTPRPGYTREWSCWPTMNGT